MNLVVIFGFLFFLTLGVDRSQADCTSKNPGVAPPKYWLPNPAGCVNGTNYNTNSGTVRCHCWSFCGYVCEPNPFPPATTPPPGPPTPPPPTTTPKPTSPPTTPPTTAAAGTCPVMYLPDKATATHICACPQGSTLYTCYPIGG